MPEPTEVTEKKFRELLHLLSQLSEEGQEEVLSLARFYIAGGDETIVGRLMLAYDKIKDPLWIVANSLMLSYLWAPILLADAPIGFKIGAMLGILLVTCLITMLMSIVFYMLIDITRKALYG